MQQLTSVGAQQTEFDSSEWEYLPADLRTHLHDWRTACEMAKASAEKEDPETDADISYWEHQLKVLDAVETLLSQKKLSTSVINWIPVEVKLPSIDDSKLSTDEAYLVKDGGHVKAAKLFSGKPLTERYAWQRDEEGRKERHWVSLENGWEILNDVTEWASMSI